MNKFLAFLTLDLASKYIAAIIEPDNSFFKLHYNHGLAFNYDAGFFSTYVLPFLVIPIIILLLKEISPRSIPLMLAGMIGNLFCRFLPSGVVDFINFQIFTNNLADIFIWIAYGVVLIDLYKYYQMNKQEIVKLEFISKEKI